MAYSDGTFTSPAQNGTLRRNYPFAQNGDKISRTYAGEFVVLAGYEDSNLATINSVTNLLTYSEQFDHANWTKTNTTVTANAVANPNDGTANADFIKETATTAQFYIGQGVTYAASTVCVSVFLRGASRSYAIVYANDASAAQHNASFYLSGAGSVYSSTSGVTASITYVGAGWYHCYWTRSSIAAGLGDFGIIISSNGTSASYAGSTSNGLYAWGAQVAQSSLAMPHYVTTTSASASGSAPFSCPIDPLAYLVEEGEWSGSGLITTQRKYATIPAQQVFYSSRTFVRPNYSGMKSGSTYAASLDGGRSVHHWTSRKTVLSTETNQGTTSNNTLPSGTVTVTMSDASTATFAANASKATIDAALAGLVNTSTKLLAAYATVGTDGSWTTITLTHNALNSYRVSSVTGPTGTTITSLHPNYTIRAIGSTVTQDSKTLYVASHGASVGNKAALWNGDTLLTTATVSGVSGTDYLSIILSDLDSPELNITSITFDSAASARYNIEPAEVLTRETLDFYLPGVSSGIATGADVAMATIYGSAQQFLDRIVAGDTYTAIACSLEPWLGPIIVRKTTAVKMSSALQSMSVT